MPVNTMVYFPQEVYYEDVAIAMAILAGNRGYLKGLDGTDTEVFEFEDSNCLNIIGCNHGRDYERFSGMLKITFEHHVGKHVGSASPHHESLWHVFSTDNWINGLQLKIMPKSTPFWIAICKRLVDIFGGGMIYRDDKSNCVQFDHFQKTMKYSFEDKHKMFNSLTKITQDEMEECTELAAYKV